MTGMKQGAGEDPFADDDDEESGEQDTQETQTDESTTEPTDGGSESRQSMQIPYKFRRDGVQDGRNRVPLFLQPETKTAEREMLRDLEDHFDDDISLTDLREALVMVGLENREAVEEQLEEWGYGMTFE